MSTYCLSKLLIICYNCNKQKIFDTPVHTFKGTTPLRIALSIMID